MFTVTPKRFTIAEYQRLGELGFFPPDEQFELIRGEIVKMPFKKTPHSVCNALLVEELILLLRKRATVRRQEPIILPTDSEPQPDLVIVRNKEDHYLASHPYPEDILLVAEISDSTLRYDRDTKLPLYAENNIAHYWIFNLIDSQLEAYSEPFKNQQGNFGYRSKRIFLDNEMIVIPLFPDLSLDLSKVFP